MDQLYRSNYCDFISSIKFYFYACNSRVILFVDFSLKQSESS